MPYIIYYRSKKGKPYFGGQRKTVNSWLKTAGGEVLASYNEVETVGNKRAPRPQLQKAIAHACKAGATLVIARLDRLARNAGFTGYLAQEAQASGLKFICLDNPSANATTIHILSAVAQEESRRISLRNREVMARLKAEGKPLGSARPGHWKGREHKRGWRQAVPAASKARSEKALREYQWLLPEIKKRRTRGDTMDEIVRWLNDQGKVTTAGKPFSQASLWRVIKRYLGDEYLGNVTRKGKYRSVTAERKEEVLAKVVPKIKQLREEGLTFHDIADRLNEEGYQTPRGSNYSQSVVWNIVKRYIGKEYLGATTESEGALRA